MAGGGVGRKTHGSFSTVCANRSPSIGPTPHPLAPLAPRLAVPRERPPPAWRQMRGPLRLTSQSAGADFALPGRGATPFQRACFK